MKKILFVFFALLLMVSGYCHAQDTTLTEDSSYEEEGAVQVFLIDSYITPEVPHKFMLTYYTSDSCKSYVVMAGKYKFNVSPTLTEEHKTQIDITGLKFDSADVQFVIYTEDKTGNLDSSEVFDVAMPEALGEEVAKASSNLFLMCCLGGTVFLLPSPTFVSWDQKNYFSLTKEIPVLSLQATNYEYPIGYFAVEYSYIFSAERKNFLRAGYKHLFQLPYIDYVSPGINWFTDTKGFNGISPEVSLGFFKIYDLFTFYTKYRYNFRPGKTGGDFHEISLGLYSGFFTFHLTM